MQGYFTNYRIHKPEVKEKIRASIKKLKINEKFKKLEFIAIHLRELHGTGDSKIKKRIDNIKIEYYSIAIDKIIKNPYLNKIKYGVVFCDTFEKSEKFKIIATN